MSISKKFTKHFKQWRKNIALWTVILVVLGTLIAVFQTYYAAKQSRIANESLKTSKKELNENIALVKAKPSIRYYLLDQLAMPVIYEPWLKRRTDSSSFSSSYEHKQAVTKVVLSNLRLDRRPLLLRTGLEDHFVTIDKEEWEGRQGRIARKQDEGQDLIDFTSNYFIWEKIIKSNRILNGTSSYANLGEPGGGRSQSLDIDINGANYTLIYVSIYGGCTSEVGDIIYPYRYSLVADISNDGNAELKNLSLSGDFFESDYYQVSLIGATKPKVKKLEMSVPFPLAPGEHVFLYLSTIFSHSPPWGEPSLPWFYMGPWISLDEWEYLDSESNINVNAAIRQFNVEETVTVSGNILRGSCPYIIFRNSDGNIISEKRILIEAVGLGKKREEIISIPAGTMEIIIDERDPEVSFIEKIEFYQSSSFECKIIHNNGIIKLRQGDSYNIPIDSKYPSIKITGYYVPLVN